MPAESRIIRPKARTMDNMISLKTRKPDFDESLKKDEKQTDAIIKQENVYSGLIKTTCSSNRSITERLELKGDLCL